MSSEEKKYKKVSFSQFSKWLKCPYNWYLDYPKKLRDKKGNIYSAFGTAIHEAMQEYLTLLYNDGLLAAESLDIMGFFKTSYERELTKLKDDGVEIEDSEILEFYDNATDIIDSFLKTSNRLKYFPTKDYELVGIEIPLDMKIKNNVEFMGFIDVVLKNKETGKYKIIDIKTSTQGWNKWMKEDFAKYSQVLLYKAFYSKKFNVKLSQIEVEFFIVKRTLYENVSFPQNRIQTFKPNSSKREVEDALNMFIEFLNTSFTEDGEYIMEEPEKIPGKNKKNCKYCQHYKTLCDAKPNKK